MLFQVRDHEEGGWKLVILERDASMIAEQNGIVIDKSVIGATSSTQIEDSVIIGTNCVLGARVYIHRYCKIASECQIDNGSEVHQGTVLEPNVYVGRNAVIGYNTHLEENAKVRQCSYVGPGCNIGRDSTIRPYAFVGPHCIIGHNVCIMEHARVDAHAIIGDNATVPESAYIYHAGRVHPDTVARTAVIAGELNPVIYNGDDRVDIGCERHTILGWYEKFKDLANTNNVAPEIVAWYKPFWDYVRAQRERYGLPMSEEDL
jgi:NDP-sugar pyrophosphorylase family protein